jgi:hypothetical protein
MKEFVKLTLMVQGTIMAIFFFVYVIANDERWFSRLCCTLACLGFLGIINAIENLKNQNNE